MKVCWQSLLGLLLSLLMSPHSSTLHVNPCTLLVHASMGTAPFPLDYKEHVMRVTNRTIEAQRQSFTLTTDSSRVNSHSQYLKVEDHPRNVNLAILSYASTDIWDYASYSFAVNAVYAERNEYYIVMYDEHTHNYEAADSRWNKVKILERSLHYPLMGDSVDMDYVVWVDADFIFLDFSLRLEQIAAEHPKAHIIMSAEHAGSTTLINSGCIIVKNSRWSRSFLNEWWELADRRLYSDQEQFDLLFEKRRREAIRSGVGLSSFLDKVAILPPHRLNSDPPAMSKQRPGHQCLHLMGEHTGYRKKVFSSALQELCRCCHSAPGVSLPLQQQQQLGLTQQNLLAWALQEYSEETKRFFEIFEDDGLGVREMKQQQQQLHGLESCRRFANAVHHYAHALAYSVDVRSNQYRSSVQLRKSLYSLLHRNVASWRAELQQQQQRGHESVVSAAAAASIRRDWPELLKVVATAGQHILNADSGVEDIIGIDDKRRAADEILLLLEEMLQIAHPGQRDAVMLMVADVHQQLSIILLLQSDHLDSTPDPDYDPDDSFSSSSSNHHHHHHHQQLLFEALQHAQTSLQITLPIAERSGQHLLMSPLSIAATCLSANKQYSEAVVLFEHAIQLIEATLGPSHDSTAPVLVNFGISLYESGHCDRSLEVLSRASEIALSANMSQQSVIFKKIAHYSNTAALCEMKK